MSKKCICGETNEAAFPATGRYCRACKAAKLREYRRTNNSHVKKQRQEWRKSNRNKINEQKRVSYLRNADKILLGNCINGTLLIRVDCYDCDEVWIDKASVGVNICINGNVL